MGSAVIDLKGLMLGDALDRAKESFDTFEKVKKKPVKKKTPNKKKVTAKKTIAKKKAKTVSKKTRKRAA